jgi:hypothetical protein
MALVHEQLYQSNDFSQIDFQDYLETLCVHLRSSYHLSGDISVSVSAVGVMMGLDIAVPCGLLITELVTNSFQAWLPCKPFLHLGRRLQNRRFSAMGRHRLHFGRGG